MTKKKSNNYIVAYKVFNPDWTCLDFQYEVGKKYTLKNYSGVKICKIGFHACKKLVDCFSYYGFKPENKVAIVHLSGSFDENGNKICSSVIKIVKELSWLEVLELVNTGKNNTGRSNSGSLNSGDSNSGRYNSGSYNSGSRNSGHYNSGSYNSGSRNSGNSNSGHSNSGRSNSGSYNSGSRNSGDSNSGNSNSGHYNSGHYNSGSHNSGNYNSSNFNSGFFNSENIPIFSFNKPTSLSRDLFISKLPYINLDIELGYKKAWAKWWKEAKTEDRNKIRKLPNFSGKVFAKITGIKGVRALKCQ